MAYSAKQEEKRDPAQKDSLETKLVQKASGLKKRVDFKKSQNQ